MNPIFLTTVLGQTSSGKSDYAVQFAQDIPNSVIVNCDSRQIYKKLDIGTGKVPGIWENGYYIYEGVKHLLIDYIDPKEHYDLAQYIRDFIHMVETERNKGVTHFIVVGGTGLYAQALVDQYQVSLIHEEYHESYTLLKDSLQKKEVSQLQESISNENHGLNESDFHNPRRLINYILRTTAQEQGWTTPLLYPQFETTKHTAIQIDQTHLKDRISSRLKDRMNDGLIDEVKSLEYLGSDRLNKLGLEYRIINTALQMANLNKEELFEKLLTANLQLARRQYIWLKKRDIEWIRTTT